MKEDVTTHLDCMPLYRQQAEQRAQMYMPPGAKSLSDNDGQENADCSDNNEESPGPMEEDDQLLHSNDLDLDQQITRWVCASYSEPLSHSAIPKKLDYYLSNCRH